MGDRDGESVDYGRLAREADALSSPQRIALLHLLTTPRSVEEMASTLHLTRQGVHRHLRRLLEDGMVTAVPGRLVRGRAPKYIVATSRLFEVATDLAALGRLHVEREARASAPPDARSDPHLTILNGPEIGGHFALGDRRDAWRLGRARDNDFRLWHDPAIAAHHAEVRRVGERIVFTQRAVGKATPTRVDFQRTKKGADVDLVPGAVLELGATFLVLQKGTVIVEPSDDVASRQRAR